MTARRVLLTCLLNLALGNFCAWGSIELDSTRRDFEYGKFQETLDRAQQRISRGNLSEEELKEWHKYAGLSAFNLNRNAEAISHWQALLQIDPDFRLDPFSYPPAVIQSLEKVRTEMGPQLETIRQAHRLKEEAERELEQRRRQVEALTRRVETRTIEHHSRLIDFVPFGVGQFAENRPRAGVIFAAVEGLLAATSLFAYLGYGSLIQHRPALISNVQSTNGSSVVTQVGIPRDKEAAARNWQIAQYASAGGFYAAYACGTIDALMHHQDTVRISISPLPGGISAGLSMGF